MRRVIIESPFAGEVEANARYLKIAVIDCLHRGESPYASHGFFTHFLDDTVPAERKAGILAGLEWAKAAEAVIYYLDRGMSSGMLFALEKHVQAARKVEVRLLAGPWDVLTFKYKNWRGEQSIRRARFQGFYWGRTEYHPRDQILMKAHCLDRNEDRVFAVADMIFQPSGLVL